MQLNIQKESSGIHRNAMRLTAVCVLLSLFNLWTATLAAQEFPISSGNITTCGGFFVDSGSSAAAYGTQEDYTVSICADSPENIISLHWNVFSLGTGDMIEIFDGPAITDQQIGTYTLNDLQNQDITSTNSQGCLTIHFESDGNAQGNFAAEISCGLPCQNPVSQISTTSGASPLLICPGESVTFSSAGSVLNDGSTISSFVWNFEDGQTDNTSWPLATHTFSEPGAYKLHLDITDSNGCSGSNGNEFLVFVSTYPNFNLITEVTDLCTGGEVFLGVTNVAADSTFSADSLNTWISKPWTDIEDNYIAGGMMIEDDQTQCQDISFTYNNFQPGSVIDAVSEIDHVYINFEHSFMQDLIISIICPNGQAVVLHQQEGTGTDLGEPATGSVAGVGYNYTWSPQNTAGTWGSNADGIQLPAGDYSSFQPLDGLVGCPLNGTWTLQFCDTWAGDDGYLFNYGIQFEASNYSSALNFAPNYGPGCDSTYWSGPGITEESSGCDYIKATLTQSGTYEYEYTAINDFGCVFDTTITIFVDEAPLVSAGSDQVQDCLNPQITLEGGFVNLQAASFTEDGGTFNHTYGNDESITWTFCPDDGFENSTRMIFTFISGEMEEQFERFIVYDGPDAQSPVIVDWTGGDATGMSWTAANSGGCLTIVFVSDFSNSAADGDFMPWTYEISGSQVIPEFEWYWSPAPYLSSVTSQNAEVVNLDHTQTFILTGYPAGQPNCASQDEVIVEVTGEFTVSLNDSYSGCAGDIVTLVAPVPSGGSAPFTAEWTNPAGEIISQDTITAVAGLSATYCLTMHDACGMSSSDCTTVSAYQSAPANFEINHFEGCEPLSVLMVSECEEYQLIDNMTWYFGDGDSANTLASANHEYTEDGIYYPWLVIDDIYGCRYIDTLDYPVRVFPRPEAAFTVDETIVYLPNTTFSFTNETTDGEQFLWNFDVFEALEVTDTSYTFPADTEGNYTVELYAHNQYGCSDMAEVKVTVEQELDIYIPNSFTPDNDGINDVWQFKGTGFEYLSFKIEIFNRWGVEVYSSQDPLTAWTGNYGGGDNFVPDGEYFYKIYVRDTRYSIGHIFDGNITVIR